jgi:hypothetical protein
MRAFRSQQLLRLKKKKRETFALTSPRRALKERETSKKKKRDALKKRETPSLLQGGRLPLSLLY